MRILVGHQTNVFDHHYTRHIVVLTQMGFVNTGCAFCFRWPSGTRTHRSCNWRRSSVPTRRSGANMTRRLSTSPWRQGFASPPSSGPRSFTETWSISPTCSPSLTRSVPDHKDGCMFSLASQPLIERTVLIGKESGKLRWVGEGVGQVTGFKHGPLYGMHCNFWMPTHLLCNTSLQ